MAPPEDKLLCRPHHVSGGSVRSAKQWADESNYNLEETLGQSRRPSRDNKLKDSPVWLATSGPQAPAVGFDDRAADCQSQSHAVGLCRVEWFKETRDGIG
jgi:hypothetical protein